MRRFVPVIVVLLGLFTAIIGVWALGWPDSFSETVNFPPHRHFVHDVGAFQLGIGATLLLAAIWADAILVALGGYLIGAVAHTLSHLIDSDRGGSPAQTVGVGLLALLAAVALVLRWRQRGWVVGEVGTAAPELAALSRQKTVLLTTYRRNGTPVGTPVSIAADGAHVYLRSFEKAGKTRRLRANPAVTVAPSTMRGTPTGTAVSGTLRRLTGAEDRRAAHALARKYPMLQGLLVPLAHRIGRAKTGRTVHFELTL